MIKVTDLNKISRTEEIETMDASVAQRTINLFDGRIVSNINNELQPNLNERKCETY